MTDEVRVVAVLKAQPGQGAELVTLWPELSVQVQAEDGCLGYDLHRVSNDPDSFVVLERWASLGALAAHSQAPHMREFGARAAGILAAPPDVMVLEDAPAG